MVKPEYPQAHPIPQGAPDPLAPPPPAPQGLQALQQPVPHMPPLNWSHFKPEFLGKPEEDAEEQFT